LNWSDMLSTLTSWWLCAPRPVYQRWRDYKGDGWVDAKGSFLAAAGAGPVYRLLGRKDMGTTEFLRLRRR
jgi:hypothetical protein